MPPPNKKRRVKESAVEEVVFDFDQRAEWLTGFHKRKVQRTGLAKQAAQRREREERIQHRKEIRDERKQDLEAHVKAINAAIRPEADLAEQAGDEAAGEGEWNGLGGPEVAPEPVDHEAEYIDDDKYTTVIVEEVDVSKDGLAKLRDNESSDQEKVEHVDIDDDDQKTSRNQLKKKKPASDSNKKSRIRKKREFRYESKEDRKMNRAKEKLRKSKQAKARREAAK